MSGKYPFTSRRYRRGYLVLVVALISTIAGVAAGAEYRWPDWTGGAISFVGCTIVYFTSKALYRAGYSDSQESHRNTGT